MADTHNFCYLSKFDLFEDMQDRELREKAKEMHGKKFTKGDVLYSPHQESQTIYVLEQGEVILYQSHEGRRETFDTIGPGALFGNFNLEVKTPSHYAEATRDSEVCAFPINDFLEILRQKPELMLKFIQTMAERIQDYERRFKNNLQTAKETIYEELFRLKEKRKKGFLGKYFGADGAPIRLTHEQIATITGLNRVTVTRSLKELKDDGMISVDPTTGIISLNDKGEIILNP